MTSLWVLGESSSRGGGLIHVVGVGAAIDGALSAMATSIRTLKQEVHGGMALEVRC